MTSDFEEAHSLWTMISHHKELVLVVGSGVFVCICCMYALAMLNTYRKIKRNSHQIINGLQAVQDTDTRDTMGGIGGMAETDECSRSSFRTRSRPKHISRRSHSHRSGQFMTLHQSKLSTQTYETHSVSHGYDPYDI